MTSLLLSTDLHVLKTTGQEEDGTAGHGSPTPGVQLSPGVIPQVTPGEAGDGQQTAVGAATRGPSQSTVQGAAGAAWCTVQGAAQTWAQRRCCMDTAQAALMRASCCLVRPVRSRNIPATPGACLSLGCKTKHQTGQLVSHRGVLLTG